jgi:hypothetical protein
MRTVAVYPGRFHIFTQGHKAVYDHLVNEYGADNVYIATSAKQNNTDSPFTIDDKQIMMTKMGVPPGKIVPVTNPYKIDEIAKRLGLDTNTDHLIYALGVKDAERFHYTKESPLQLKSATKKMKPVSQHAYVEVVPTQSYNIMGHPVQSASAIRKMYQDGSDHDRDQIIHDLYGATDPELRHMFDERLGLNKPDDGIIYGKEQIYAGDGPVNAMKEHRERLINKIHYLREQLAHVRQTVNMTNPVVLDYIDEKRPRKK